MLEVLEGSRRFLCVAGDVRGSRWFRRFLCVTGDVRGSRWFIRFLCVTGHVGCVEVLLTWGADVDQDLPNQGTALYSACLSQELLCVRQLLRDGESG